MAADAPGATEAGTGGGSPGAAESLGRRGPLRFLGPAVTTLVAGGLIGLLAYGLLALNPNTTIDDSLAHQRAAPAPPYRLELLQAGDLGPRLTAPLTPVLADRQVSSAELRGTPYVLNFWASWCVPCGDEAPLLERTWRQTGRPRGVLFVGLDMQDTQEDARSFTRHFAIDYLNIRDPTDATARSYGATGVPETFFISAHGNVVNHVIGVVTPTQLQQGIGAAIAGRPQATRQGGARNPTR